MRVALTLAILILIVGCASPPNRDAESLEAAVLGFYRDAIDGDAESTYAFVPLGLRVTCTLEDWKRRLPELVTAMPELMRVAIEADEIVLRDVRIEGDKASFLVVHRDAPDGSGIPAAAIWEEGRWRGYPRDGDFGEPPCAEG